MHLFVNKERYEFPKALTTQALLGHLNLLEKTGMAVAVNNKVIPKKLWESHTLHPNDEVTIIQATQGG